MLLSKELFFRAHLLIQALIIPKNSHREINILTKVAFIQDVFFLNVFRLLRYVSFLNIEICAKHLKQ